MHELAVLKGADINNLYLGKLDAGVALHQLHQPVFARYCVVVSFERRCSGAEEDLCK